MSLVQPFVQRSKGFPRRKNPQPALRQGVYKSLSLKNPHQAQPVQSTTLFFLKILEHTLLSSGLLFSKVSNLFSPVKYGEETTWKQKFME